MASVREVTLWRRNLCAGDPLRDWFYVWSFRDLLRAPSFKLRRIKTGDEWAMTTTRLVPSVHYLDGHQVAARLPANIPPGDYEAIAYLANDNDPGLGYDLGRISVHPAGSISLPPVVAYQNLRGPFAFSQQAIHHTLATEALYYGTVFQQLPVFAKGGMFLNCAFHGLPAPYDGTVHSWSSWGLTGPCAIVASQFLGTDRGPRFSLKADDIEDMLISHCTFSDIAWIDNGNELIVLEAEVGSVATLRRMLYLRNRVYACEGDLTFFHAKLDGLVIKGCDFDRASILFRSEVPESQRRIEISSCEFRGGGIELGNGTADVVVRDCGFLSQTLVLPRGNRQYSDRNCYDPSSIYVPKIERRANFADAARRITFSGNTQT